MTASSVEAMHSIDALFDKIAVGFYFYQIFNKLIYQAITDIDIMPGVNDPRQIGKKMNFIKKYFFLSCHMLPQQPLHPCMFPSSSKRKTSHCLTNPYDFQIGDIR